jgi:hypothetical protein
MNNVSKIIKRVTVKNIVTEADILTIPNYADSINIMNKPLIIRVVPRINNLN